VHGRILILLVAASSACSASESLECEDGTFCPAGTRCAAGGLCLVESDSCGEFGENAPCDLEGEVAFCASATATCEAGVAVNGRAVGQGGGGLADRTVAAVDRPWMTGDISDSTGLFELVAVRADASLVISVAGDDELAPVRSRDLTLGSEPYEMNGRVAEGLHSFRRDGLLEMTELVGLEHDPATGTVAVQVGRAAGSAIADATVELEGDDGDGGGRVLYFASDGNPDPAETSTAQGVGAVLILEVAPGRYRLSADRPEAVRCVGAGADHPDPIELEVVAGETTDVGWFICEMAEAAPPISGPARSRSRRSSGRSGTRRPPASSPGAAG
jgi:hypothetical protein